MNIGMFYLLLSLFHSIYIIILIFCLLSILKTNVWMNHTNYMYMFNNFDKFYKYKEIYSPAISVDFPSESSVLQGRS